MSQHQCKWQTQRQLLPVSDGWRRWDKAYQLVMHGSSACQPLPTSAPIENSPLPIQLEVNNEDSNLCEGLYPTTSSNSDH